ncbi:GntR family transcriptional regulator [Nocardioides maradonensis]
MTHATNADSLGARYRSLRDVACDELREQIIESVLPPGERLVERDIADQLGVSRIVVREAIQQLAGEGLVTVLPRRGTLVSLLDVESAEHLFEVRLALEPLAAGAAAKRRTDTDLQRLEDLVADAKDAVRRKDPRTTARLNNDIHEAVVEAAHNPILTTMMRSVSGQVLRMFRIAQAVDAHALQHEHRELLDLIRSGSAAKAERLMRSHVAATRESTIQQLRRSLEG